MGIVRIALEYLVVGAFEHTTRKTGKVEAL